MEDKTTGRILVVDDNEMNRDLLARRLKKNGHEISMAEDGQVALEIMEKEDFDLVLLDVMMPRMSGYEALEAIKKDERWRNIPVLMISALTEMDSVVRCIELGAEDYLPKPFKTVLLHARVAACLAKKFWHDKEKAFLEELHKEKQRTEDLLKVILPEPVIAELKETNTVAPRRFDNVGVIFCDVVGFTSYCDGHAPEEVVRYLQELVLAFEQRGMELGVQKIKTIGDAYMACTGLLTDAENPALDAVRCAFAMQDAANALSCGWQVRVGVHQGPIMAGIVGHHQYLYDVWGDTVNTAARIQTAADPGAVCVSKQCWDAISEFATGSPFTKDLRGKGEMEIYHVHDLQDPELTPS